MGVLGNIFGGDTGYSNKGPSTIAGTSLTNQGFELQKPYLEDLFGAASDFYYDTTTDDAGAETVSLKTSPQYQGETIAQFAPEQERAFNMLSDIGSGGLGSVGLAGSGQFMERAKGLGDLAGGTFDTATARQYMNPYIDNVTRQAEDEVLRRYQTEIAPRIGAESAANNAYGGSRAAILAAEGQRNVQRQIGDIRERGLAASYDQGRRAFESQKERERGLAGFYGQLAESAPRIGATEAGLVSSVGEQRRAFEQTGLDRAQKEFIERRDDPIKNLAGYQSILQGFPYSPSTYEVATKYAPQPSFGQQLLGALGTGASLYGAFGGFNPAGGRKRGGLVGRRSGGQIQGGLASLERHQNNALRPNEVYSAPRKIPILSDQIRELLTDMGGPRKGDIRDWMNERVMGFRPGVRNDILDNRLLAYIDSLSFSDPSILHGVGVEGLDQTGRVSVDGLPAAGARLWDTHRANQAAAINYYEPPSPSSDVERTPFRTRSMAPLNPTSGAQPILEHRKRETERETERARRDYTKGIRHGVVGLDDSEAAGNVPNEHGRDLLRQRGIKAVARRQKEKDAANKKRASEKIDPLLSDWDDDREPLEEYLDAVSSSRPVNRSIGSQLTPEKDGIKAVARRQKEKDAANKKRASEKIDPLLSDWDDDREPLEEYLDAVSSSRPVNRSIGSQLTPEKDGFIAVARRQKEKDAANKKRADDRPAEIREQAPVQGGKRVDGQTPSIEMRIPLTGKLAEINAEATGAEAGDYYTTTQNGISESQVGENNNGVTFYESPHDGTGVRRPLSSEPLSSDDPKLSKKSDPMDKYFQEYINALSDRPTGEQELTEADERLQKDMWLSLAAAFSRFGSTGHPGGIVPAFLKEVPQTVEDVKKAQKAYREDQKYARAQNALVAKDKLTADLARQNIFLKRLGIEADIITANAALLNAGQLDMMDYQDFTRMLVQFTNTSNLSQLTTQKILAEAMRRVQENPKNLSKVLNETYQWVAAEKNRIPLGIKEGDLPGGTGPVQGATENALSSTKDALLKLERLR